MHRGPEVSKPRGTPEGERQRAISEDYREFYLRTQDALPFRSIEQLEDWLRKARAEPEPDILDETFYQREATLSFVALCPHPLKIENDSQALSTSLSLPPSVTRSTKPPYRLGSGRGYPNVAGASDLDQAPVAYKSRTWLSSPIPVQIRTDTDRDAKRRSRAAELLKSSIGASPSMSELDRSRFSFSTPLRQSADSGHGRKRKLEQYGLAESTSSKRSADTNLFSQRASELSDSFQGYSKRLREIDHEMTRSRRFGAILSAPSRTDRDTIRREVEEQQRNFLAQEVQRKKTIEELKSQMTADFRASLQEELRDSVRNELRLEFKREREVMREHLRSQLRAEMLSSVKQEAADLIRQDFERDLKARMEEMNIANLRESDARSRQASVHTPISAAQDVPFSSNQVSPDVNPKPSPALPTHQRRDDMFDGPAATREDENGRQESVLNRMQKSPMPEATQPARYASQGEMPDDDVVDESRSVVALPTERAQDIPDEENGIPAEDVVMADEGAVVAEKEVIVTNEVAVFTQVDVDIPEPTVFSELEKGSANQPENANQSEMMQGVAAEVLKALEQVVATNGDAQGKSPHPPDDGDNGQQTRLEEPGSISQGFETQAHTALALAVVGSREAQTQAHTLSLHPQSSNLDLALIDRSQDVEDEGEEEATGKDTVPSDVLTDRMLLRTTIDIAEHPVSKTEVDSGEEADLGNPSDYHHDPISAENREGSSDEIDSGESISGDSDSDENEEDGCYIPGNRDELESGDGRFDRHHNYDQDKVDPDEEEPDDRVNGDGTILDDSESFEDGGQSESDDEEEEDDQFHHHHHNSQPTLGRVAQPPTSPQIIDLCDSDDEDEDEVAKEESESGSHDQQGGKELLGSARDNSSPTVDAGAGGYGGQPYWTNPAAHAMHSDDGWRDSDHHPFALTSVNDEMEDVTHDSTEGNISSPSLQNDSSNPALAYPPRIPFAKEETTHDSTEGNISSPSLQNDSSNLALAYPSQIPSTKEETVHLSANISGFDHRNQRSASAPLQNKDHPDLEKQVEVDEVRSNEEGGPRQSFSSASLGSPFIKPKGGPDNLEISEHLHPEGSSFVVAARAEADGAKQ